MNIVTHDIRKHILETGQILIAGKGFTAVGLSEILKVAEVPKGSFYYYFSSKEVFGEALLQHYFTEYLLNFDNNYLYKDKPALERLMSYWGNWVDTQANCDPQGKCLAVKLAAEVSDLSEAMRLELNRGTQQVIKRISCLIEEAIEEGSLSKLTQPNNLASILYQLWLGSSLRAKITRNEIPLLEALDATNQLLNIYSTK